MFFGSNEWSKCFKLGSIDDLDMLISRDSSFDDEIKASNAKMDRQDNKLLSNAEDKQTLANYWNYTIEIVKYDDLIMKKFNSSTYDQVKNNCLDFIFFFFCLLDLDQLRHLDNKFKFCEQIIQPKLTKLFKLIEFSNDAQNISNSNQIIYLSL